MSWIKFPSAEKPSNKYRIDTSKLLDIEPVKENGITFYFEHNSSTQTILFETKNKRDNALKNLDKFLNTTDILAVENESKISFEKVEIQPINNIEEN